MGMADAFAGDTFSLVSLSNSLNKLPFKPSRIGAMGLFVNKGVRHRTVILEEKAGTVKLLPTVTWGGPATPNSPIKRNARNFSIVHLPLEDRIDAGDVQDVRAFGSESSEQAIAQVVNDKLSDMKQNHETTLEWLRMGAIHGNILDADGSTVIYNLFTAFGISETSVDFVLGTTSTDVRGKCMVVKRAIEDALGAAVYTGVHAFCGETWWDKFVNHDNVKAAYERWQDGEFLRNDPRAGFTFAGITFEAYRATVSGQDFVNDSQARFFPKGVPGLYQTYYAPADFVETVNTIGQPYYAKQELEEFGRGVKLHTQSNPLPLCTIPGVLVKGTTSN